MRQHSTTAWRHGHTFGQDRPRLGERRSLIVLLLTGVTMIVEIVAGWRFGSVALLADGLHMGSHTAAIGISFYAYRYARHHAADPRFAFGTGKVNALAGYTGAILLVVFALAMAWESVARLLNPVHIDFVAAILVAVAGLVVNAASVLILGAREHGHDHGHHHDHGHAGHHGHEHHAPSSADGHVRERDMNLRSAYLHVLADTFTSVLAIVSLLAGLYLGAWWMDPLMGFLGAALVTRWSLGLLRETSPLLLDHQAPDPVLRALREAIEGEDGNRIYDLHVWSVAPEVRAAAIGIASDAPRSPDHYRALIPESLGIAHATIEVREYKDCFPAPGPAG